jgi:hypothetical protein
MLSSPDCGLFLNQNNLTARKYCKTNCRNRETI